MLISLGHPAFFSDAQAREPSPKMFFCLRLGGPSRLMKVLAVQLYILSDVLYTSFSPGFSNEVVLAISVACRLKRKNVGEKLKLKRMAIDIDLCIFSAFA